MHEIIYKMYADARRMVKEFKNDIDKKFPIAGELLASWEDTIKAIECEDDAYKKRYNREVAIQKSFTEQQVDWICSSLDHWYFEWKGKIANTDGTHRLGFAKELLKERFFGDRDEKDCE